MPASLNDLPGAIGCLHGKAGVKTQDFKLASLVFSLLNTFSMHIFMIYSIFIVNAKSLKESKKDFFLWIQNKKNIL